MELDKKRKNSDISAEQLKLLKSWRAIDARSHVWPVRAWLGLTDEGAEYGDVGRRVRARGGWGATSGPPSASLVATVHGRTEFRIAAPADAAPKVGV